MSRVRKRMAIRQDAKDNADVIARFNGKSRDKDGNLLTDSYPDLSGNWGVRDLLKKQAGIPSSVGTKYNVKTNIKTRAIRDISGNEAYKNLY